MINTILMAALALLAIGAISGAAIWFVVWVFKKIFHLDE